MQVGGSLFPATSEFDFFVQCAGLFVVAQGVQVAGEASDGGYGVPGKSDGLLMAGIEIPRVAEWAGHSIAVLLKVYVKFIDGGEQTARAKVDRAPQG